VENETESVQLPLQKVQFFQAEIMAEFVQAGDADFFPKQRFTGSAAAAEATSSRAICSSRRSNMPTAYSS
jgi:hypothetical protein